MEDGEEAQELYELILDNANRFLRNANRFEMHILQDHSPTYAEIAEIMHSVALLITDLADEFDAMLGQKATDYVYIMQKMGIAIRDGDAVGLNKLVDELEGKPFL